MAKFGQGDKRWIVEERPDGTNVHNWHWVEKDCLEWSKKTLSHLLEDIVIMSGEGNLWIRTTKVEKVDGEAYVNIRKGKIIPGYEMSVRVLWEGEAKDAQGGTLAKVTGRVELPYIADENAGEGEDPDINITVTDNGPVGVRLREAFLSKGKPIIFKRVRQYVDLMASGGPAKEELQSKTPPKSTKVAPPVDNHSSLKPAVREGFKTITLTERFNCRAGDIYDILMDDHRWKGFSQSNANISREVGGSFSLFDGAISGVNQELQQGKLIVQKWRFNNWIDGHYSTANEDESESVFIDEDDVIDEISIDGEDLPDADVEGEDVREDNGESEPDETSSSLDDAIHTFEGHEDTLFSVACSPVDATWVASGGGDDKAFMWRIGHTTPFFELKGHTDSVVALSFSNDGLLLASGGLDGVVRIWDASTGNLIHVLDGPGGGIEWVRWHPKGHLVLAGSEDYTTWMWNADLGKCFSVYTGHSESVTCGDFTPDGKTICTGSADGSLRVWNPQTQESKLTVKGHPYHTEGLTCLNISSDSTLVVSGSTEGSVHVVNIKNGKVVGSLVGHSGSIECVGFSPSLTWVATGGMDKKLMIWELQSSSLRCTCQHEEGVMRLSWSSSSRHIISASLDGIVRLWDSRSGVCERVFQGHSDSIQDMAITVDQRFILTGSDDKTAKVFEIEAF